MIFLRPLPHLLLAAVLLVQLAGCAYSPGLSISAALEDGGLRPNSKLGGAESSNSGSWPSWLPWAKGSSTAPVNESATSTPPPGVLRSITPDLIAEQRRSRPTAVTEEVRRLFGTPQPYRIGPGDVLGVTLWSHPELVFPPSAPLTQLDPTGQTVSTTGFSVSHDGFIQFPFVGRIKVAGLTEDQARSLLIRTTRHYLKEPQITVRVMAFRSGRVYVDGEVRSPGVQAVNDVPLTLPDAIGRAGGFTPAGDRSAVALTRNGKTTLIDLDRLSAEGVNPSSILLASGDVVRVLNREDSRVYVLGEVLRPAPLVMRNGRMTLGEALGEGGGVNQASGDPRQIYVVRNGATGNAEIYHLDARSPLALALAGEFELKPRDIVYVDPAPLVRWNRVISLLLPSAGLLNTTSNIGQ